MTLTDRQLCDARFGAGLELGELAVRAGMNRDRLASAEVIDALVILKGRRSAMRRR